MQGLKVLESGSGFRAAMLGFGCRATTTVAANKLGFQVLSHSSSTPTIIPQEPDIQSIL